MAALLLWLKKIANYLNCRLAKLKETNELNIKA
jgi:hypothetical protein